MFSTDQLSSSGRAVFATSIAFGVAATVATAVRLALRYNSNASIGTDDWLIVAACLLYYGLIIVNDWGDFAAAGGKATLVKTDYPAYQKYLLSIFVAEFPYVLSITCCRLGILWLYRRLFPTRTFKRASWAVAAVCIAWAAVSLLVNIFACQPVNHLWHPLSEGHCLSTFSLFYVIKEAIGTVLEAVILILPVPTVIRLQMPLKRRLMLIFVFALGIFVVITNAVKCYLIYKPNDEEVDFEQSDVWTTVHGGVAIICACLPTFRPLMTKMAAVTASGRQKYGYRLQNLSPRRRQQDHSNGSSGSRTNAHGAPYSQLNDSSADAQRVSKGGQDHVSQQIPEDRIGVTKTIEVV